MGLQRRRHAGSATAQAGPSRRRGRRTPTTGRPSARWRRLREVGKLALDAGIEEPRLRNDQVLGDVVPALDETLGHRPERRCVVMLDRKELHASMLASRSATNEMRSTKRWPTPGCPCLQARLRPARCGYLSMGALVGRSASTRSARYSDRSEPTRCFARMPNLCESSAPALAWSLPFVTMTPRSAPFQR